MGKRARAALVGAALSLGASACGYDYVDRRAAVEGDEPAGARAAGCCLGEPAADAVPATGPELAADAARLADKTLRVRGTLRARGGAREFLETAGGPVALELTDLPPWWMDTCVDKVVDVDGKALAPAKGAEGGGPLLHASAIVGVGP